MDIPHATLVLQELATLHASSHIYESKLSHMNITLEWPCLQEMFMQDEMTKKFLSTVFGGQIEGGAKIMEKVRLITFSFLFFFTNTLGYHNFQTPIPLPLAWQLSRLVALLHGGPQ